MPVTRTALPEVLSPEPTARLRQVSNIGQPGNDLDARHSASEPHEARGPTLATEIPSKSDLSRCLEDLRSGALGTLVWLHLAWLDTRQRYRRSLMGPFWITISTGIMVLAMGPLYGTLLKQNIGAYLQHLAVSLITWNFLAGFINESCTAFISAEGFIKQIKLPLSVHLLRVLAKNLIMFAHNALVILLVLLVYPPHQFAPLFLTAFGLVAVVGNLLWVGLILAILCARFRDIPQIVSNVVQVAFFLTPIIWEASMLGPNRWYTDLNPFFHLIDVIRAPLLGDWPRPESWLAVSAMFVVGWAGAVALFSRYRARIAYWV